MKTPFKRLLFMWVIFYVTVEGDGHKGREPVVVVHGRLSCTTKRQSGKAKRQD